MRMETPGEGNIYNIREIFLHLHSEGTVSWLPNSGAIRETLCAPSELMLKWYISAVNIKREAGL